MLEISLLYIEGNKENGGKAREKGKQREDKRERDKKCRKILAEEYGIREMILR